MTYIQPAAQALLVVVFAWAAAGKLHSRAAFARFAVSLGPLTSRPTQLAAGLAVSELATAVLLVLAPGLGFPAAIGLLAVLSFGVAVVLRRGLAVTCRCFGASARTERLGGRHLARNIALLAVAGSGQLAGLVAADARPSHSAGFVVAIGGGMVIALLFVWFDDLAELFS